MKHLLDEFEYDWKLEGKAASTVKLYKEQLVELFERYSVLDAFIAKQWMSEKPTQPMRRKRSQAIRAFGAWAEKNEIEGFNWWKNFLGMNATPISGNQIATGVFLASFVRVVGTVIIYWFVMLAFGALESSKAWLAIPTAVMAGVAFGSITQAIAGLLKDENMFFVIFNRFVMMPLFLFSGTFYPLSSMPIYLQWIGWISPLWHATELGRYLTYGHALTQTMAITHMVFLVTLLVLGVFFSRRIFTTRLAR